MIDEDPTGEGIRSALAPIVRDAKWLERQFPYMVLCLIMVVVIAVIVFLPK